MLLQFTRATTSTHFFFAVFLAIELLKNDSTGKLSTVPNLLLRVKEIFLEAKHNSRKCTVELFVEIPSQKESP